ncbi:glycoside hydrolase family 75 protein [Streptomyces sp. NBC_00388]|uniref:glycoside hydrolase family 75 protein n=1 Tax=Streptomyces sp. NBC_00388 TaxID=2975735 RepID=UPI003FA6B513
MAEEPPCAAALLITAAAPFAAALPASATPHTTAATPQAQQAQQAQQARKIQEGSVSAADLLAKVGSCSQISSGKYRTDEETSATVPVCGKSGAVFWKADMDVDCDGQVTTQCNADTDPWFQDDTAFHQSDGKPLSAAALPYVVVPSSSGIWDYSSAGIKGGGVVAVIYNNKVEYAVVGDTGPDEIIGEASYSTAKSLGIDPDPETGGTDSGVTYILFKNSKAAPIESHSAAVTSGEALAKEFIANN